MCHILDPQGTSLDGQTNLLKDNPINKLSSCLKQVLIGLARGT
jgi:hypothetical protein